MGVRQTEGHLVVSYPGETDHYIDEIKEFTYRSDVMAVGDVCEFTIVNDRDGSTMRKLRSGSTVKLKLKNPAVNGGSWTLKHFGRIVQRQAAALAGTVHVVSPDLGWHLMNCDAPLFKRLRGLTLDQLIDPANKSAKAFLDPTFQLQGLRTGLDANQINRRLKQGRAGTLAFVNKVLTPVNVIQVGEGESFHDVITRYCQRFNLLINVSCDGFLQAWNPNYSRAPAYRFYRTETASNIIDATRHDDISTRYTEVKCVGEVINKFLGNTGDPNAFKIRGTYRAATDPRSGLPLPLPFTNRLTKGDGEMFSQSMADGMAEWLWKRGMFDSHYLEVTVSDHWQPSARREFGPGGPADSGGAWYESDEMCEVNIPELDAVGLYYVQSATCTSTVEDGDKTKLVLRWPWLLSASFGEWPSPPIYGSSPEAKAAVGQKGEKGGKGS